VAKLRVVIDTNVFVSALISPRGRPAVVLAAYLRGDFTLLLSESQMDELRQTLQRPALQQQYAVKSDEVADLLFTIERTADLTLTGSTAIPVRDPKDAHILAAALTGAADYLVTGDHDLLVLADDPRLGSLRIVTVAEFADLLAVTDAE